MKQTTALEVIEDMEEGKKIFVVFKSPYCHYCQALEPVLEYLQRTNKDLDMRYIDTQSDDFGVFEDHIDGVPSIVLVSEGKFSILEEFLPLSCPCLGHVVPPVGGLGSGHLAQFLGQR